jgi:hypothetical protein
MGAQREAGAGGNGGNGGRAGRAALVQVGQAAEPAGDNRAAVDHALDRAVDRTLGCAVDGALDLVCRRWRHTRSAAGDGTIAGNGWHPTAGEPDDARTSDVDHRTSVDHHHNASATGIDEPPDHGHRNGGVHRRYVYRSGRPEPVR